MWITAKHVQRLIEEFLVKIQEKIRTTYQKLILD